MNYKLLKESIKNSNYPYREFANVTQKTESGLRRSIENQTLTVFSLEKICDLLEISPSTFFDDASSVTVSGSQNHIGGIGNGNRIFFTSPEIKALRQRIKDLEQIISTQKETITSQLKTIELLTKK